MNEVSSGKESEKKFTRYFSPAQEIVTITAEMRKIGYHVLGIEYPNGPFVDEDSKVGATIVLKIAQRAPVGFPAKYDEDGKLVGPELHL
jgi:hypothetical protein